MYSIVERTRSPARDAMLRLLPVLIPVLLLFGGGLLVTVLQSVGWFVPIETPYTGFAAYRELVAQGWFWESFVYSGWVALSSALISVALGLALAYVIWRSGLPGGAIVYKIPLILPHIAIAFLLVLFASRSGVFASIATSLGIFEEMDEVPSLLYRGNGVGLILAYVCKETSFATLLMLGVLTRVDPRYFETARNLGASQWMVFRRVLLPFLAPVINTTGIMLFLYSFGAFDIPYLLSESRPQMLSIFVYSTYFQRDLANRPIASAALVLMFVFAMVLIALYSSIVRSLAGEVRKL